MKPIQIATSPLTNRIYVGTIHPDGQTWNPGKQDLTGPACAAVAQHVLKNGQPVIVIADGTPLWEITVRDLQHPQAPDPLALDRLLAELRKLQVYSHTEIDGEEGDGTPKSWRDRPFVSLTRVERLVRAFVTRS